jgi:FkbM family methyltransferase
MKKLLARHPQLRKALSLPLGLRHSWNKRLQRSGNEVVKRIGETVQGSVAIEVKEFDGVFSINPRSHLLHRFLLEGHYEPRISQLYYAHIRPEDDILDVGANVGFFTVGGAKRLTRGKVLAAEPTTEAFNRLRENIARNGVLDRVVLFKGMVGLTKGQAKIYFVPGREEYSSMNIPDHHFAGDEDFFSEPAAIEPIDGLVHQYNLRPALMKVDVEGAEFSVFAGAQKTLSTFRPVVISELWRGPTRADGHLGIEIIQMFQKLDYIVLNPHDTRRRPGQEEYNDIICIPEEKYDSTRLQF